MKAGGNQRGEKGTRERMKNMKVKEGAQREGEKDVEKKRRGRDTEGEPRWYKDHMANVEPI